MQAGTTFKFCEELINLMPDAEFYARRNFTLKEVIQYAKNRVWDAFWGHGCDWEGPVTKRFSCRGRPLTCADGVIVCRILRTSWL
jgi:hypothetical protein